MNDTTLCPDCGNELEFRDTTHSNYNSNRASVNQHTGNIYKCNECDCWWLENLLTGTVERWNY